MNENTVHSVRKALAWKNLQDRERSGGNRKFLVRDCKVLYNQLMGAGLEHTGDDSRLAQEKYFVM